MAEYNFDEQFYIDNPHLKQEGNDSVDIQPVEVEKTTPVLETTDAPVQGNDASSSASSGDSLGLAAAQSSDLDPDPDYTYDGEVDDYPAIGSIIHNFGVGKFKMAERKAYEAYRKKDPNWHKYLPALTEVQKVEQLQDTVYEVKTEQINEKKDEKIKIATEKIKTKQTEIQNRISDEVGDLVFNDDRVKGVTSHFEETFDFDNLQKTLAKEMGITKDSTPEELEAFKAEYAKRVNKAYNEFLEGNDIFNTVKNEQTQLLVDKYGPELDELKFDVQNELQIDLDRAQADLEVLNAEKWDTYQPLSPVELEVTIERFEKGEYTEAEKQAYDAWERGDERWHDFMPRSRSVFTHFYDLFTGMRVKGAWNARLDRYNNQSDAVKNLDPKDENYAFEKSKELAMGTDLLLSADEAESFAFATSYGSYDMDFLKDDGSGDIDWNKVVKNRWAAFEEFKKQVPQSAIALLPNVAPGPFKWPAHIVSGLFYYAQMRYDYLEQSVPAYLDGKYGEGNWGETEYLEFIASDDFDKLDDEVTLHAGWTSQIDRFTDGIPLLSIKPKKKLAFLANNFIKKYVKNKFLKTGVKSTAFVAKTYFSAQAEGHTELAQDAIGLGIQQRAANQFKDDSPEVYDVLVRWYTDKDSLTPEQIQTLGTSKALGTLMGGGMYVGGGALQKGSDFIGRKFDIDFLKTLDIDEQFTRNPLEFTFMGKKAFNENIENVSKPFAKTYNDPASSPQQRYKAEVKLRDLNIAKQAYNEAVGFKLKGKQLETATKLLQERAKLKQVVDHSNNTGLAANAKERIKAIDERLQRIHSSSKSKQNKGTLLERIRRAVGPGWEAVGAKRASTLPEKIVDRVGELFAYVDNKIEALSRLGDTLQEFNLTESEIKAIENIVKEQVPELSKYEGSTLTSVAEAQRLRAIDIEQGLAPEDVQSRYEKAVVMSRSAQSSLDSAVTSFTQWHKNKSSLVGRALAQSLRTFALSTAENRDVANQTWIPGRIKNSPKEADSTLRNKLKNVPREIKENIVAALQEFQDIKDVVDSLVIQYINENLAIEGLSYNETINRILEIDQELENNPDNAKELKKEQRGHVKKLEGWYAKGLYFVEKDIAENVEDNNYPPYFDIGARKFDFTFENKFGQDLLYDAFPENGKAIFDNMVMDDWYNLILRFNRWNNKTGNAKTKEWAKVVDWANKVAGRTDTSTVKVEETLADAERRAIARAIKTSEVANRLQPREEVEKAPEVSKEEEAQATVKWGIVSKDDKIRLEGEIAYLVGALGLSPHEDANVQVILSSYVNLVGAAEAQSFLSRIAEAELSIVGGIDPSYAKLRLLQDLWYGNQFVSDSDLNNDVDIEGLGVSNELKIASLEQRITEIEYTIDNSKDAFKRVGLTNKLVHLKNELHSLKNKDTVGRIAPKMDARINLGTVHSVDQINTISFASSVLLGHQLGSLQDIGASLKLDGIESKMTLDEFKRTIAMFEAITTSLADVIDKQAEFTSNIRQVGLSTGVESSISQTQMSDIESLIAQSKQLDSKRQELVDLQYELGKTIAAAELGRLKVEGLKTAVATLNVPLGNIGAIPKGANKQWTNDLQGVQRKIAKLQTKIDEAIEEGAVVEHEQKDLKDATERDIEVLKLMHKQAMLKFEAQGLESLINIDVTRSKLNLDTEIPTADLVMTASEKKRLNQEESLAADNYLELRKTLEIEMLRLTKSHEAFFIRENEDINTDDMLLAAAFSVSQLYDGQNDSAAAFITNIASILNLKEDPNLSEFENKAKGNYVASFIAGVLEKTGMLVLQEPKRYKDPMTYAVANETLAAGLVIGSDLANDENSIVARKKKLNQRLWTQPQYEKQSKKNKWVKDKSIDGLKMNTTGTKMSPETHPNAFRILNKLENQWMSQNNEYYNVIKLLMMSKHPALEYEQKIYDPDPNANERIRKDRTRDRDQIVRKADAIDGRQYRSKYKFGSRGRFFAAVAYITHQANKLSKGGVQFGEKKAIGKAGFKWALADLAELAGAAKLKDGRNVNNLEDLVKWEEENLQDHMTWISNPLLYADKIFGDKNGKGGTDEDFLFVAAALNMRNALKLEDPTKFKSNYIPYIDDTMSGFQMMGGALKSANVLQWVNQMPGGLSKADFYIESIASVVEQYGIPEPTPEQLQRFNKDMTTLLDFKQKIAEATERVRTAIQEEINKKQEERKASLPEDAERKEWELTKEERKEIAKEWKIYEIEGKDGAKPAFEYQYLKDQRKKYREGMNKDEFNGIAWAQSLWLERTRDTGKQPVMTTPYGAAASGMANAIYDSHSQVKDADGNPLQIVPEMTSWMGGKVKASIISNMPEIDLLTTVLKDIVVGLAAEGRQFEWTGKFSDIPFDKKYYETTKGIDKRIKDAEKQLAKAEKTGDETLITDIKEGIKALQDERNRIELKLSHESFTPGIGDANNRVQLGLSIGKSDMIDVKAAKKAIIANFAHTLDKEKVAIMILDFMDENHAFLANHDAYGTHLATMDELFNATREAYFKLFSGDILRDILSNNMPEGWDLDATVKLLMVDTWKPEYTFYNQQGTSKSGKADKSKLLPQMRERMGVEGDIADLDVELQDGSGNTVSLKDGNVVLSKTKDAAYATIEDAEVIEKLEAKGETVMNEEVTDERDKVERALDDAIGFVEKGLGPEGSMQVGLHQIPVHVILGGLKSAKLIYSGGKNAISAIAALVDHIKLYFDVSQEEILDAVNLTHDDIELFIDKVSFRDLNESEEYAFKSLDAFVNSLDKNAIAIDTQIHRTVVNEIQAEIGRGSENPLLAQYQKTDAKDTSSKFRVDGSDARQSRNFKQNFEEIVNRFGKFKAQRFAMNLHQTMSSNKWHQPQTQADLQAMHNMFTDQEWYDNLLPTEQQAYDFVRTQPEIYVSTGTSATVKGLITQAGYSSTLFTDVSAKEFASSPDAYLALTKVDPNSGRYLGTNRKVAGNDRSEFELYIPHSMQNPIVVDKNYFGSFDGAVEDNISQSEDEKFKCDL